MEALRKQVGGAQLMAVVKADGYGHGMIPAARAALAGGAQWLGVVHVPEALALRQAGLTHRVLCLTGVPGAAHEEAVRAGIDLTADSVPLLAEIAAAAARAGPPGPGPAQGRYRDVPGRRDHGRLGRPGGAALAAEAGRVRITGIWSHLACADIPGHPSIAASAAVPRRGRAGRGSRRPARGAAPGQHRGRADSAGHLVRPGPAGRRDLRAGHPARRRAGLAPPGHDRAHPAGAGQAGPGRDAGVLRAPVHHPGESTLGLIPLGYAEGIPRRASGVVEVQARGGGWRIAGTVCMDLSVLDFGAEPAQAGDEVVLFGPGDDGEPTAQEWADALGTVSYEIVDQLRRPAAPNLLWSSIRGTVSRCHGW